MKKLITLVLALAFTSTLVQAQSYDHAVGIRFGIPNSASYKKFINETDALEAILSYRKYNDLVAQTSFGAAYQRHNPIESVDNLNWYYGAGANVNLLSYSNAYAGDEGNISFGLNGYLGLSYVFPDFPLELSVDWVPTFILSGYGNGFGADYGALSARYILGR